MCEHGCKEDRNLYSLLKREGVSDAELATFIGKMIMHLQLLAMQAKLPDVVQHLDAAISACAAKKLN